MFIEYLEHKAEKDNLDFVIFPMLVDSKLIVPNRFSDNIEPTANIQLFANVQVEGSALNTQQVYFEVTGSVADIPFHAKSNESLNWTCLKDFSEVLTAKSINASLHSLRLSLIFQVVKNMKKSKVFDSIFESFFLDAVDACYPNIDLNDNKKALDQLSELLTSNDFNLRSIERHSTGFGGDKFTAIDKLTYQAQELLFNHLEKNMSADRVRKIRNCVCVARKKY